MTTPNRTVLKVSPNLPTNWLTYLGLFHDCQENQICGEATPSYLYYHDRTIKNIKALHPEWQKLKIIIILREPIDKIKSHYRFIQKYNLDPDNLSLLDSILQEDERKKKNRLIT